MPSGLWKTIFAQRASSRSHLCARERQTALASTEPRFGPCLAGRTMATAKVMAALTGLSLVWCKRFPQATPLAWDAILGRTLLAPRRPFSASPLRGLLPRCVRVALGPPCQADAWPALSLSQVCVLAVERSAPSCSARSLSARGEASSWPCRLCWPLERGWKGHLTRSQPGTVV